MLIGDNAYEIVPGWLGQPRDVVQASAAPPPGPVKAGSPSQSDAELLASFLARKL